MVRSMEINNSHTKTEKSNVILSFLNTKAFYTLNKANKLTGLYIKLACMKRDKHNCISNTLQFSFWMTELVT